MITCLFVVAGLVVAVLLVMRPDILRLRLRVLGLELVARRGMGAAPTARSADVPGEAPGVHQVEGVSAASELPGRAYDLPRTEESPVARRRGPRGRRAGGAAPHPSPSIPPRRVSPRKGKVGKGRRL
jgi:hypothetical protein